jgi:hypothetical protein
MTTAITISERTVLIIPVTRPVMANPLLGVLFLRSIAAMTIAGIPRINPGPVNETIPRIIDAIPRLLIGGGGAIWSDLSGG